MKLLFAANGPFTRHVFPPGPAAFPSMDLPISPGLDTSVTTRSATFHPTTVGDLPRSTGPPPPNSAAFHDALFYTTDSTCTRATQFVSVSWGLLLPLLSPILSRHPTSRHIVLFCKIHPTAYSVGKPHPLVLFCKIPSFYSVSPLLVLAITFHVARVSGPPLSPVSRVRGSPLSQFCPTAFVIPDVF